MTKTLQTAANSCYVSESDNSAKKGFEKEPFMQVMAGYIARSRPRIRQVLQGLTRIDDVQGSAMPFFEEFSATKPKLSSVKMLGSSSNINSISSSGSINTDDGGKDTTGQQDGGETSEDLFHIKLVVYNYCRQHAAELLPLLSSKFSTSVDVSAILEGDYNEGTEGKRGAVGSPGSSESLMTCHRSSCCGTVPEVAMSKSAKPAEELLKAFAKAKARLERK